jgi:chemotaxis response regulator CheB
VRTPRSAVRVLVIDRDRRVRAALRPLLASEPDLTLGGEAADAASALGQLAAQRPDAVLVAPLLPTAADGTPVVRAAAEAGARVIVLTADRSLRTSARRLGGAAALDKDGDHEQLLAALRGPATPAGDSTSGLTASIPPPGPGDRGHQSRGVTSRAAASRRRRGLARDVWFCMK